MKKAKALFAAGIIVIVAGMSAALWYLNDSGKLHNDDITEKYVDEYADADNGVADADDSADKTDKKDEVQSEDPQTTAVSSGKIGETEINDFLSAFASVYFSENGKGFDIKKCSDYELIQFAYLHIRNTDKDFVILEQRNDSIGYYHCVPYDSVEKVVKKYFGVQIPKESAYTEKDYAFFSYSNDYFYTPAADGLGYGNTAVADSVEYRGDSAVVRFSVYSGAEKHAEGEAEIRIDADNMNLVSYRIYD
ncbi:MAG: hypothetical protein J6Q94_06995 [Clostridia bacterium]|nr:hypothetical protein [Clostridia bacterium]